MQISSISIGSRFPELLWVYVHFIPMVFRFQTNYIYFPTSCSLSFGLHFWVCHISGHVSNLFSRQFVNFSFLFSQPALYVHCSCWLSKIFKNRSTYILSMIQLLWNITTSGSRLLIPESCVISLPSIVLSNPQFSCLLFLAYCFSTSLLLLDFVIF